MKLLKKAFAVLTTTVLISGCAKTSKIITVNMSKETEQTIVNMGFGEVYYLEKEGWDSVTYPGLVLRGTGYVPMETKDYKGNPYSFQSDYNDKYNDINFVSSFTPKSGKFDRILFYIHGGAYINGASYAHTRLCDNLSVKNNALVIAPNYGLVPQCTYEEAYRMLDTVYEKLLTYNKNIVIMGDSAGGGLSVSYTMRLKEQGKTLPNQVVLLSPWLDITMSNPDISKYQKDDRMLAPYGLIEAGKYWAGNLDTTNYLVSPINGDFTNFPETLLFRATWEIFYPDEVKFEKKMLEKNRDVTVAELQGFVHAAPLFYYFSEYENFLNIMHDFIK